MLLKNYKMNLGQNYLGGRENKYYYLIRIKKEFFEPFKKKLFIATYSNGFNEFEQEYFLGEDILTIIER